MWQSISDGWTGFSEGVSDTFRTPSAKTQKERLRAKQSRAKTATRENRRKLERTLPDLRKAESSAIRDIKDIHRRIEKKITPVDQGKNELHSLAKELVNVRKTMNNTLTAVATLNSIERKMNEQSTVAVLQLNMKTSTELMKEVNSLVSLGVMSRDLQRLSQELVKAEVIDEMVSDIIDQDEDIGIGDAQEDEIEKVLSEILPGRKEPKTAEPAEPAEPAEVLPSVPKVVEEKRPTPLHEAASFQEGGGSGGGQGQEEAEPDLLAMRGRLGALRTGGSRRPEMEAS